VRAEQGAFALFPERARVDAAAAAFHRAHPEVMEEIVLMARRLRATGRDHWGIHAAFNVVRYERELRPDPRTEGEPFRINNNHAPWYAREIMARYPDRDGMFALRARVGL
jgi:hypothetical protein